MDCRAVVLSEHELYALHLAAQGSGTKAGQVAWSMTGPSVAARGRRALECLEHLERVGAASYDFNLGTWRATSWGRVLLDLNRVREEQEERKAAARDGCGR